MEVKINNKDRIMRIKISEKKAVSGLTVVSLLLLTAMTVMPAVAQSNIGLGFSVEEIARATVNGDIVGIFTGLFGYTLGMIMFAVACADGPISIAAAILFL